MPDAEKPGQINSLARLVLRPKVVDDATDDYRWRQDPLLAYLDATSPVTTAFDEYLRTYQEELEKPYRNYVHYGIDAADGRHIGNCMIYDIDEWKREAQLGILIGERDFWDKGYGEEAIRVLLGKAFEDGFMTRVYLHTLRDNFRAQKCFEKCGFKTCGKTCQNGYDFVVMEIRKDDYKS